METAMSDDIRGPTLPSLVPPRIAFLRERLADQRLALADARAAYLCAQQLALRRPRLRVDGPMLLGFVLAMPLVAVVICVVIR
jgi:hypothetical protein